MFSECAGRHRRLAQAVQGRYEEIFEMVQAELRRSGFEELVRAGMVLTGGASKMEGVIELAEEMLQKHRATKAATRTRSGSSRARKKPAANEASTSTSPPGRAKPAGKAAAKPEKKPAGKTGPARKTKP